MPENRHSKPEVAESEGRMRKRLLFRALENWDERATADFNTLPFDSVKAEVEMLKATVGDGGASLEGLYDEAGNRLGTTMIIVKDGVGYVVELAITGGGDESLYESALEAGERRMRGLGCHTIRTDATRPAVLKKLMGFGFVPTRVLLSKKLD